MQNLGLLLGPGGIAFGPVTGLPLDLGAHLSTFAGLAAILGVFQVGGAARPQQEPRDRAARGRARR